MESGKIDYFAIIKESFSLVWRKKVLALFGFFVVLGSLGNGIFVDSDEKEGMMEETMRFVVENPGVATGISIMGLVLFIIFIFLRAVGVAALIKNAGGNLHLANVGFRELFKKGKTYALKIITLDIFSGVVILLLLFTLSVPVLFLVVSKAYVLAFLVGSAALLIFLPVLVLIYFTKRFAYVFMVVSGMKMRDSVEKAYEVFSKNIAQSVIFSIIVMGLGFLFMFIGFLSVIPLAIVFFVPTIVSFFLIKPIGYVILGIGLFLAVAFFMILQSFFEAFRETSWVLLVKLLAGIKEDKKKVEKEIILLEGVAKVENI